MTTEKLYVNGAAELMAWLDENPTAPFTIERKWMEEQLASKLETIADRAADEDDAAYQVGYDTGYDDGFDAAKEEMASEIEELESKIEDLEAEVRDLEEQSADSFAQGYQTATQDNDAIETFKLS
jgi:flagellar biosynthesis/type III secretory pathway protein FliH